MRHWVSRNRGPLLWWSAVGLVLAATGVGVYVMLPQEPRWVRVEEPSNVFYAGDGRIGVCRQTESGAAGPLQVLDAGTGEELARFLDRKEDFLAHAASADGRLFVALTKGDKADTTRIVGVDLRENREWQASAAVRASGSPAFSPGGDYVALPGEATNTPGQTVTLVETASGRVVARVRLPSAADEVLFATEGGHLFLSYQYQEEGGISHIRTVDTQSGKEATFDGGHFLGVAPNGKCLIADRGADGVWVGDVTTAGWRCRLEGAYVRDARRAAHLWTVNGALLIDAFSAKRKHAAKFALWADFDRGAGRLWTIHLRRSVGLWVDDTGAFFSPDSRLYLWSAAPQGSDPRYFCYDLDTGKPRWQRPLNECGIARFFLPDLRRLVATRSDPSSAVHIINAETGVSERTLPMAGLTDLYPSLTRDGRTLMVTAAPPEEQPLWLWAKMLEWLPKRAESSPVVITVFDVDSGDAVGQLWTHDAEESWLTEDRHTLITFHDRLDENGQLTGTTLRGWDLPPRKPLRWLAAAVLAAATLLWCLRLAWRGGRLRFPAFPGILMRKFGGGIH